MTATVDIAIVERKNILVVRTPPSAGIRDRRRNRQTRGSIRQDPRPEPHPGRRQALAQYGPTEPPTLRIHRTPRLHPQKRQTRGNRITPGITDGRHTEITDGNLKPDMPVIVSVKPAKDK